MELIIVLILLVLLTLLGAQLFLVIGGISLVLFFLYLDLPMFYVVKTMFDTVNNPMLLAIPLYIFAGAIMARGEIAKRLIDLAHASLGWLKGGLAVSCVLACILFAAISGSSPVTLIAIGTIMYPALIQSGYKESVALGVLTVSGSLGILIPPSIPMIIFSIVTGTDIDKLFIAGVLPGAVTGIILMILCVYFGYRDNIPTKKFSSKEMRKALWRGISALIMPVLVLGGIYSGIYTVTEAGAIAAVYAIILELLVFRQMKIKTLVNTLYESVLILGIIFIIIVMATVFNRFLTLQDVPFMLVDFMQGFVTSQGMFLLFTLLLLIVVGLFMDVISAILIIAPLVVPLALVYDVDLVHLGIIFILGLEVGYVTPPIGINLFVASGIFNKPFNKVASASVPYLICLLLALLLITYVPDISLFLTKFVGK